MCIHGLYLVIVATSAFGCISASPLFAEVKQENLSSEAITSSSDTRNGSMFRTFECSINGLSEEQLAEILKEPDQDIILTVDGSNKTIKSSPSTEDDLSSEQIINLELNVINGTLLVKGEIQQKSSDSDVIDIVSNGTSCEVVFQDVVIGSNNNDSADSAIAGQSRDSGQPPVIVNNYNHVVLMLGAPEQIVGCKAKGNPTPKLRWFKEERVQAQSPLDTLVLNEKTNRKGQSNLFLFFSQVTHDTFGNYTCEASNEFGITTKSFEIQVMSVESTNLNCIDDEPEDRVSTTEVNQQANEIKRPKRNAWYQWRRSSGVQSNNNDQQRSNYHRPSWPSYPESPRPPSNNNHQRPHYHRPGRPSYPQSPPRPPSNNNDAVDNSLQQLVNILAERLLLADLVAVNKWDNDKPVEDIPREQIILEKMVKLACDRGLDGQWAQTFFQEQIGANKDIQFELIGLWEKDGRRPEGPPVDLENDVRPKIDEINNKIMDLAKSTESEREQKKCQAEVEKNARYTAFAYNLDDLHQKALQRATDVVCLCKPSSSSSSYPYHDELPPGLVRRRD